MRSLAAGFRAIGHGKLILLLALTTALLGFAAAMPLTHSFAQDFGGTLAGDHLIRNHPTFAPTDVLDFLKDNASAVQGAEAGSRYVMLLTVLLQAFFAGGIVVVLGRGPFAFSQFFEPSRRNFWHNLKCLALFAILAIVVLGAFLGAAYAAGEKIFAKAPPGDATHGLVRWVTWIVALLLWGAVSLLYDFARAARRYDAGIGAWRSWGFARRALRGSWIRGLVLFLFWFLIGGAAWLVSLFAAWIMPAASPLAIVILLALQFLTFVVRAAVRVAAWGSYLEFLDHRAAGALVRPARRAHGPIRF